MGRLYREALEAAEALTFRELRQLDTWIHERLDARGDAPNREVIEERVIGGETFRLELKRCGKVHCRCARGQAHGPYWYAYRKEGGRVRSRYVGKTAPSAVGGGR